MKLMNGNYNDEWRRACRRQPARALAWMMVALGLVGMGLSRAAVPAFVDAFADREVLTAESGRLDGSNVGATREINEPRHGGKPGGRSVWISWLAPADGIATFDTGGSSFDTLLSAYYFNSAADTTPDKLREIARNDDASVVAAPTSLIQFGARAGVVYHIAVDGFGGSAGDIRLRWDFANATSPPPVIVNVPQDRAVLEGEDVVLTVDMETTPELRLQWRFNGASFGAEGPTLVIPDFQNDNVGRYTLRIDLGDVRFETAPVELQINSDGQTNALARDKLIDALNFGLRPDDDDDGLFRAAGGLIVAAAAAGVSRGHNGSQVFNTAYATPDPDEPRHCGLAGGASYWFAYSAPADGTVTLDTIGSSFDTVLAAYAFNAPFSGHADLIPITCDNDSALSNGAARIEFAVPQGRQFLVVIDGVDGARGIAKLNYRLDTNRPPVAPVLVAAPLPVSAAQGRDLTLLPSVTGSPPLTFVWRKDSRLIEGATNSGLALLQLNATHSGEYLVTVSSYLGGPLEVRMSLRVLVPPELRISLGTGGSLRFDFENVPGQTYLLEHTEDLGAPWQTFTNDLATDGASLTVTNPPAGPSHFFRLRVE